MGFPGQNEQRREFRHSMELPAELSIGSQLSLQGKLKDLSLKSAFIKIKSSVYWQLNDEVGFRIQLSQDDSQLIHGQARISRIVPGEGVAVYFVKMDDISAAHLKNLLNQ